MKYQVLFSLKNNEKILMNVVCCSHNWLKLMVRLSGEATFSLSCFPFQLGSTLKRQNLLLFPFRGSFQRASFSRKGNRRPQKIEVYPSTFQKYD